MDRCAEITVHELVVSKSELLKAPDTERRFFILLGHFGNEIVILNKIALALDNFERTEDVESKAYAVQSVFVAKLLIAKMFEGWDRLFQKLFFPSPLRLDYPPDLSEKARAALDELGKFFANSKHVATIRNEFTFHYPDQKLMDAIPNIPDDEEWKIYLSETNGNSLYYVSEMIAGHALVSEIDPNKPIGLAKMIADRNRLTRNFLALIEGCMNVFVKRHLNLRLSNDTEIKLKVPHSNDVQLPYFVAPPSKTA